jgi:hypothetical protein
MPKYTIPEKNYELEHISGLLTRIAEQQKLAEMSEALLSELVTVVNWALPSGFAWSCGRCKTTGFSLDFSKLAQLMCPACGRQSVEFISMIPGEKDGDILKQVPPTLIRLKAWFDGQADRPTEVYDNLTTLIGRLKDYGVRF